MNDLIYDKKINLSQFNFFPLLVVAEKAKSTTPTNEMQSRPSDGAGMVLRSRLVKRSNTLDPTLKPDPKIPAKPLSSRRMVPNIAVSMKQTLFVNDDVMITPPVQQVEKSFTFNTPRTRTSTMKRESLSPTAADPQLSPIRRPNAVCLEMKDKSTKRKSNLNIAFTEEQTGGRISNYLL